MNRFQLEGYVNNFVRTTLLLVTGIVFSTLISGSIEFLISGQKFNVNNAYTIWAMCFAVFMLFRLYQPVMRLSMRVAPNKISLWTTLDAVCCMGIAFAGWQLGTFATFPALRDYFSSMTVVGLGLSAFCSGVYSLWFGFTFNRLQ